MEQERKIEKWLQTYAKKRRGQAGDSFKLDPATRQMLQNEISRNAPPAEDEDDTMSLWEVLRRQWAFFLGFAVCIFLLASLFLPKFHLSKGKLTLGESASVETSPQNLRQIPGVAQSPTEGNRLSDTNGSPILLTTANPLPSSPAPAPDSGQIAPRKLSSDQSKIMTFSPNNVGQVTNLNLAENAPAPSPATTKPTTETTVTMAPEQPEVSAAAPPNEMAPPTPGTSGTTSQSEKAPPTPATGTYAVVQPPPAMLPQSGEAIVEPSGMLGSAAATRPSVQNSFLNTIPSAVPCSPVLRDFAVSQNGNMIRVVDQDGSVYTGNLQAKDVGVNAESWNASAVPESAAAASMANSANPTKVESPKMAESDKLAPARQSIQPGGSGEFSSGAQAQPQNYTFRVGGMNRTLKQSVVFTATLLEDLSAMKNTQVTFGMTANAAVGAVVAQQMVQSKTTNQMTQLPWSSLRITGTAIINRTNKIQINALPLAPVKSSVPSQQ